MIRLFKCRIIFYTFIFHLHANKLAIKQFFNHEIRLVSQMSFIIIKKPNNIKNPIVLIKKKVANLLTDKIYNDAFGLCEAHASLRTLTMAEQIKYSNYFFL